MDRMSGESGGSAEAPVNAHPRRTGIRAAVARIWRSIAGPIVGQASNRVLPLKKSQMKYENPFKDGFVHSGGYARNAPASAAAAR
jgi:hypothetical protein